MAEKLLEESESSSNSTNNAFEGYYSQDHLVGKKIKQEHVYNHKPCKSVFSHQAANLASSKSPSENTSNVSDCKIARGLINPLVGCGNGKEGCEFHVESVGGITEEETCVVNNNVDAGGLIADTFSLKDPSQLLPVEPVHLDGHVQLPAGTDDGVANGYRNGSKLVCRDDDEDYCKYYKFSDKCNKSYRPRLTWAGHRRINKSYGRTVPSRSKCFQDTKTDKKRRVSDKGLVVNSDGGLSSESVTKGESGKSQYIYISSRCFPYLAWIVLI